MPDNSYGWIVAYDKSFNHENGRNVLYADSRVEWLSEEEFFKRLDAQEERLSEME